MENLKRDLSLTSLTKVSKSTRLRLSFLVANQSKSLLPKLLILEVIALKKPKIQESHKEMKIFVDLNQQEINLFFTQLSKADIKPTFSTPCSFIITDILKIKAAKQHMMKFETLEDVLLFGNFSLILDI